MNRVAKAFNALGGTVMVRTGMVANLETTGAKSGLRRTAPVGYLKRPDGSILVGAGGTGRGWAANLRADPACAIVIRGRRAACEATALQGSDRDAAAAELTSSMPGFMRNARWPEVFLLRPAGATSQARTPEAGTIPGNGGVADADGTQRTGADRTPGTPAP
jgi:deazaflavin-dependent oxidoreductase (nitroreductase family)